MDSLIKGVQALAASVYLPRTSGINPIYLYSSFSSGVRHLWRFAPDAFWPSKAVVNKTQSFTGGATEVVREGYGSATGLARGAVRGW